MATFIKLKKEDLPMLFEKAVKIGGNYVWLARKLNKSRDMLFKYKRGEFPIPEEIFDSLIKISRFRPINFVKIEKKRYLPKQISFPNLNRGLAEILGILNGDGHLSKINGEISVIGNLKEYPYFKYLKSKFEKTFKINFKIEKFPHCFKLRTYSKQLVHFLNFAYGLPIGKKIGKLKIPPQILKNKNFIFFYIRGLFDTDGTIYIRRKKDVVLEISSGDPFFLNEIYLVLLNIGFKTSLGKNHLAIYKKDEIVRFFKEVKPANQKHLKKYSLYFN